ncbi:serine/threonine protein phosphatase [bacterium]|nr:serine/threonine protein phosphatase [bacterium]
MPDGLRVYAIGDIHGRADLLDRLISMMDQDVRENPPETRPIAVFLGDYVDRGFQSKEVIDLLLSNRLSGYETYFLKGNHEAAMLQFMGNPAIGPRWAEFGGVETLVSYGVRPPRARTNMEEWERACTELRALMPNEHYHFLTNLSLSVRIGDYVFVHAGMRPGRAIDQQTEHDMLWIRDEFLGDNSPMEAVIVHGHTPMERPFRDHRRVGVDTGAYLSGRLTAARFDQDAVDFLTTNT